MIHFITEILEQFDLIGVELCDGLTDLGRFLKVLLPPWGAVFSDLIPHTGENRESIACIHDKRAMIFDDPVTEAITRHGLSIARALPGPKPGGNLEKSKRYDQIFHHAIYGDKFSNAGGVLDHLPLWLQINTDIDGQKLEQIIQG